jgi:curved DNA-binding protein CbpA
MASNKYDVLGVTPNASDEDVRAAYLRLARISHPDLNHGCRDAESQFKAIQLAYETLRDPVSRRQYDDGFVTKAIVYSDGHRPVPRQSVRWPHQDGYDADFDISANQRNVNSRSRRTMSVAIGIVILVTVGASMKWAGQSTNQSTAVRRHEAGHAADTIGHDAFVRATLTDETGAPALESESVDSTFLTSVFGLGRFVVDSSFFEVAKTTTDDCSSSPATGAGAKQPPASSCQSRSSRTALLSIQEDWHSKPLDLPVLTGDCQPIALDPPMFSIGVENSVFTNLAQVTGVQYEHDFVDSGSALTGLPPAFIDWTSVAKCYDVPDWFLSPRNAFFDIARFADLDSSGVLAPDNRSTMDVKSTRSARNGFVGPPHDDQGFQAVFLAGWSVAGAKQEPHHPWETIQLDAPLPLPSTNKGLRRRSDPSVSGNSVRVEAKLPPPPTCFQHSQSSTWDTARHAPQNPAPSYKTEEQARPWHRNSGF